MSVNEEKKSYYNFKISISLVLLNLVINVKRFFLKYKDNIRAFLKIILRLWVNLVSK
jgi:hypothetical protein